MQTKHELLSEFELTIKLYLEFNCPNAYNLVVVKGDYPEVLCYVFGVYKATFSWTPEEFTAKITYDGLLEMVPNQLPSHNFELGKFNTIVQCLDRNFTNLNDNWITAI